MKKKLTSKSAFFNLRVSIAAFCLAGIAAVLLAVLTTSPAVGKVDLVPSGGSPTPTPTATPIPCSWLVGQDLPSVGTRSVGVFFPGDFHHSRNPIGGLSTLAGPTPQPPLGKFYAMGGRSSDTAGSDFTQPFQYDPASNSWTTKAATYPDNQVSNMACGVLNINGANYIYCVGGSAAGETTATDRVFRYDPITDTIITIAAPWPGAMGTVLPGGFSVYNNKLYILGGFDINVGMVDTIWEFTPSPPGWVQKSAHLPTALGYIPTATIGALVFTAGGSTWDGTAIHDSTFSFVYDPVADTIGNIATIPRATAETRALNFCSKLYVMGGGRDAPNPSNEVDIYDPASNSWSLGQPFVTARRNFASDTDTTTRIWLAGGYDSTGLPIDSMEIFNCPMSMCPPMPTPTPSVSPTPTPTATATTTSTPRITATPRGTPTPRPTPPRQ
jgi:N-acetylneuraminic acid mutarotase